MRIAVLAIIVIIAVLPRVSFAQFAAPILGGWEWVKSDIDGVVTTPETEGYTMQYLLGSEMELAIYRDRQAFFAGTFSEQSFWVSVCSFHYLAFEGDDTMWFYEVEGADPPTLYLSNGFHCPVGGGDPTPVTRYMEFTYVGPVATEDLSWGGLKSVFR